MKLKNYALGHWQNFDGDGIEQLDAATGELVATCGSTGLDYQSMLHYARQKGGNALRKMTFHERGRMLKSLAFFLTDLKSKYYTTSYHTGATKSDSWIDIDGGIGTLFAYASLRRKFPDQTFCTDGDMVPLSKEGGFIGHHILVPKRGVAIHINAFNFPVWGMLEKLAANWLAGVPAIVKPSEITSYLAQSVAQDIISSGIVPEGALQMDCGMGRGILDFVTEQDVVTFTGSAATGKILRALPRLNEYSVPFNMEADSLNCAVLGDDVTPDMPEFDLFIKEVRKEMTAKAGQKCTAVRRILVPQRLVEEVQIALGKALSQTSIGNPRIDGVRMGALVSTQQLEKVRQSISLLAKESELVFGNQDFEIIGAKRDIGAFLSPKLFFNKNPFQKISSHEVEAFGPVSTIMPYQNLDEAIELANMGRGSLCSSITTADDQIAREYILNAAPYHGRILVLNRHCAKESTGHGAPMPQLVHGGPGRAGGGEELGGLRGVRHYLQRTAIQGSPQTLTKVTDVFQYGATQTEKDVHVFRKYFEELEIGETVFTHKHTVTETDILNFANVSGDNFYAHTDVTSLEGTIFEQRVAHGYFVLSKAAGLFVDPKKGPVLLNYGLEECRFTKPVYAGTTIGVRFTVKEKIDQEKKSADDVAKGIVKFLVDVYDQTGETVAIATILTMVKKRAQD